MSFIKQTLIVAFLFLFPPFQGQAQNDPPEKKEKKELKELLFRLNEDGSHFVKATFLTQVWLRYTHNNPGSTIDGTAKDHIFDIGLRRTRIQLFGQITDRIFFYTQFGQNNLSFNAPRKQGLFFLDAIGEFKLYDQHLSIGAGLTGWSGLSRYASPSVGSILSLDAPLYQQATNDVNDQFLRKFSVYAKGKIAKLDYRVALTVPMSIQRSTAQTPTIGPNSLFASDGSKLQYQGYFMWQFFDQESNLMPYLSGSYLGKKRVLNVGAGFVAQPKAMWHLSENGADTLRSDLLLFAIDAFYDAPLNKERGNAITAYATFSLNNYGKNYIRNVGVMNPATGVNSLGTFNGAGNAVPLIGTGKTVFAQVGYLFKNQLLGKLGTLQLYASTQYSLLDLIKGPMLLYEGGLNWLVEGNRGKLSLGYQSRPVFTTNANNELVPFRRRGMLVMQFQVGI